MALPLPSALAEAYIPVVRNRDGGRWELELLPRPGESRVVWPGADEEFVVLDAGVGILVSTDARLGNKGYASSRWLGYETGGRVHEADFAPPEGVAVRDVLI
jgi:hypothetical protein